MQFVVAEEFIQVINHLFKRLILRLIWSNSLTLRKHSSL